MRDKKYSFLPAVPVLLGIAAAVLRAYELLTGYERETQLMRRFHMPSYVMLGFTVLCLLVFFIITRRGKIYSETGYVLTFGFESKAYLVLSVVSLMVLLVSAGFQAISFFEEGSVLYLIMALFSAFAAISLLYTLSARYRLKNTGSIRMFVEIGRAHV